VEHGDVVCLENLVDPFRGLLLVVPVVTNWATALFISLDLFWDVKGGSYICRVDVGGNLITKDVLRKSTWVILDPRSVFSESVSLLEGSLLSTDVDCANSLLVSSLESFLS
jgi:hypothetical protein